MLNYQAKKQENPHVPLTDNPSQTKIASQEYEFAVFTPYVEAATKVLDAALTKGKPFACLIPISLVGKTPSDEENKSKLQGTTKMVLLDPEMVWVMHGIPGMHTHQVQAREIHHMPPEPEGLS
jgi:hypothetical protein